MRAVFDGCVLGFVDMCNVSKGVSLDLLRGAVVPKVIFSELSIAEVFSNVALSDLSTGEVFPKVFFLGFVHRSVFSSFRRSFSRFCGQVECFRLLSQANSTNSDSKSSATVLSTGFVDRCSVSVSQAKASSDYRPRFDRRTYSTSMYT